MSAHRLSAATGVVLAALVGKDSSAAGIAAALEAAGLLQSPESAAELVALRGQVAELETAVAHTLASHVKYADSPHCEADGDPWPCHTVTTLAPAGWPMSDGPAPRDLRPGAEAARRMLRDRPVAEDPHDSPLHHTYAVGRDLPEVTA
ncbi:hypothetical protein GTX53_24165 [Streptomyces sp. SID5594]|uniref:hypothetical protein n=1 Tax=unclassified Streptomyces TaxID=2593676 RepID=UPI000366F0FE|nr:MULTISPECIES: hypothetical protein [unclassified Streptomyces]MZF56887.1 hypothetical protein [Streptomyces sp. SID5594]